MAFLSDLMPTLAGYEMEVTRVTYAGDGMAFAELAETVEVDGTPLRTPECLTFELADDGRIRRVEVFTQSHPSGPAGRRGMHATCRTRPQRARPRGSPEVVSPRPDFDGARARSSPSTASRSCAASTPTHELREPRDRARASAGAPPRRRAARGLRHRHPRRPRRGDRRRTVRPLRVPRHRGVGDRADGHVPPGDRRHDRACSGRRRGCSKTTASASCTRTPARASSRATRGSVGTATGSRARTSRVWPSVAFTIHIDATSPRNGFLRDRARFAPRRHRRDATRLRARPRRDRRSTASAATCCCTTRDLWHSAARATDDGDGAIRRHVRGGWYGGERLAPNHGLDDFVKNARR